MKYKEFKELILKIDVKDIEFDDIHPFHHEKMIEHLYNLAGAFETRFNFEISRDYFRKEGKWVEKHNAIKKRFWLKRGEIKEDNEEKQPKEDFVDGKISKEEYKKGHEKILEEQVKSAIKDEKK